MNLVVSVLLVILFSLQVLGQDTVVPAKVNARPIESATPEPFDGATKEEMRKCVDLNTSRGKITVEMFPFTAPETVRNFLNLSAIGAFDNTVFNRIVPGFVIQGGNLFAVEGKSPEMLRRSLKKIPDEPNMVKHTRGIISMARGEEPNSASSSFFILLREASTLDEKFAAFGRVTEGIEVVEEINGLPVDGETPKEPIVISSFTVADCVIKPEDATKIDDRGRFGLKGPVTEVELVAFSVKGKEGDWKKTRVGSTLISFGGNGNLIEELAFDKQGKRTRKLSGIGTIWGERLDGTAELVERNSSDKVVESTKLKRTSTSTYSFEVFDADGKLLSSGDVTTNENGRIVKKTTAKPDGGKLQMEVTYDPYGFVATEKTVDESGKLIAFFKYDYRNFDDNGNWTERWVFDSEEAENPVRVDERKISVSN